MDDEWADDEAGDDWSEEPPQDGPGLFESAAAPVIAAPPEEAPVIAAPVEETTASPPTRRRAAKTTPAAGDAPDATPAPPTDSRPPEAPLALYRRYRPDTFADVIGQEHVVEPLQRALANNKVHHAYLFSGPRGCGKTSSARILARCLNCETGPTPTPCGVCRSCRDLATGGPGSIDVIEMDAATHGLVDDARDLRERAFFAPVQSRYKVYIIDEAHMVTPQGFNALLKLVEEPPPHVRFIFATTEPDKVIGTIRSRTHHYPFRLVPPKVLSTFLARICEEEGVRLEEGVLPLVVRAGAGSVRDSLSVLDQLLGAATDHLVAYDAAAALLGYTPEALLDEMATAFGEHDGRRVFTTITQVIDIGQDPRRFAADLLSRLRDLIIVDQVPDAVRSGLIDVSADQADRLRAQAAALGSSQLTRAAEIIADGLTAMRGTTAPRLHLELMCARVLLPAEADTRGLVARLERLERRAMPSREEAGSARPPQTPPADAAPRPETGWRRPAAATPPSPVAGGTAGVPPAQQRPAEPSPSAPTTPAPSTHDESPRQRPASVPPVSPPGAVPVAHHEPAQQPPREPSSPQPPRAGSGPNDLAGLRQAWPRVLDEVKGRRRATWILLNQNAQVAEASPDGIVIALATAGLRDSFAQGHSDVLSDALARVFGGPVPIRLVVGSPGTGHQTAVSGAPARGARPEPAAAPAIARPGPPTGATPDPPSTDADFEDLDDDALDDPGTSPSDLLASVLGAEPIDDLPD